MTKVAMTATIAMLACACGGKDDSADRAKEYASKSKATEARTLLKKIGDGARMYYLEEHVEPGSLTPATPQFPGGKVGPTPPLGACCKTAGKCAPSASQWEDPIWQALLFSIDDAHYYSYEYVAPTPKAAFTARAYGDLDCDGVYSTFEIAGTSDQPMTVKVTNELE